MPLTAFAPLSFLCLSVLLGACAHTGTSSKSWEVIAHRGASGYIPEHTLAGAAMAAGWGVDFIEPDIVLSRDNVPVVLHDIHLETSTDVATKFPLRKRKDGRYYVRDFSVREIKTLNVLERSKEKSLSEAVFPNRFSRSLNKSSFKVPTLEEFLEFVEGLRKSTGKKLGIYPEMKASEFHAKEGQDIVKIVYQMLQRFGYEDKPELIYIQSFNPNDLKRLRSEFGTKLPLVQLIAKNSWGESSADYDKMLSEEGLKEISLYANGIGPGIDQILTADKESQKIRLNEVPTLARKFGLKVHPYTHRRDSLPAGFKTNAALFETLKEGGTVDGIFSDFADEVLIWEGRLKR